MKPKDIVKTSMNSMKKKKGTVRSIDVEKADDDSGYVTTTHYNSGAEGHYMEPATHAHKNLKSVHDHMKEAYESDADMGMGKK